jgi:Tol biopolymer transport system component
LKLKTARDFAENPLMARKKTRADFLSAAGALLVAGCSAGPSDLASSLVLPSQSGTRRRGGSPSLVTPKFVIDYKEAPDVTDYRPAVNADGSLVIFERTFLPQPNPQNPFMNLFTLELGVRNKARRFQKSIGYTARADWSWQTGKIAFENGKGVWLAKPDGSGLTLIPNTTKMIYPSWYPHGKNLAVYNNNGTGGAPNPCTTKIDLKGNVDISVAGNPAIFGGFPNVHPAKGNLIVIAGQPVAWNLPDGYNQAMNYIYVVDTSKKPNTTTPLDSGAPQQQFDPAYQARAPFWSPDGKWIVFESNRASSNKVSGYAIFIQDAAGQNPPMQVTDPKWNCQHAKWFADGQKIVVASSQKPGGGPFGIATLDVSAFVSSG